jgi:hypothetical protein
VARAYAGLGVTTGLAADRAALSGMVAGQQFFETDTKALWIFDGSVWSSVLNAREPSGLVLVSPSSVSGTGASVSNGLVSFTGTSHIFVNGVFSSQFKNYRLVLNGVGSLGTVANVRWRWRAGGVDFDNNYNTRMWYNSNGNFTTANSNNATHTEWQYAANIQFMWTMDIFNPNLNTSTSFINHHQCFGGTDNLVGETHSFQNATRIYDGFSINPTAGTMTGSLSVYGVRGSI